MSICVCLDKMLKDLILPKLSKILWNHLNKRIKKNKVNGVE